MRKFRSLSLIWLVSVSCASSPQQQGAAEQDVENMQQEQIEAEVSDDDLQQAQWSNNQTDQAQDGQSENNANGLTNNVNGEDGFALANNVPLDQEVELPSNNLGATEDLDVVADQFTDEAADYDDGDLGANGSAQSVPEPASSLANSPNPGPTPSTGAMPLPPGPEVFRVYEQPARADELNHRIFRNRETASILPPIRGTLWWVGFDYQRKDGFVRVEIVTRGDPRFAVLQEVNQAGQPELLLRFYETDLRPKIRRAIDASEFKSPISYIRMRESELDGTVDVLVTFRDAVRPRLYAKQGNVLLTFEIPERYYGNLSVGQGPIEQAQILPIADIRPIIARGSDLPEAIDLAQKFHYPDHSGVAFLEAPSQGGDYIGALPAHSPGGSQGSDSAASYQEADPMAPMANLPAEIATPPASLAEPPAYREEPWADSAPLAPVAVDVQPQPFAPAQSQIYGQDQGYDAPTDLGPSSGFTQYEQPLQQNQDGSELQLQEDSEIFEEDGLDDFDDGDGDAADPAAKFEVRYQTKKSHSAWVVLGRYSLGAVGQDSGEDDFDDFSNTEEFALEQNYNQSGDEFAESMDKTAGSDNLYSDPNAESQGAGLNSSAVNVAPANGAPANANPMTNASAIPASMTETSYPQNAVPQNTMPQSNVQDVYPNDQDAGSVSYRPENPTERLISTSFKDMPLDYVLKIIMEETKINYIMNPAIVKTPVTIEIHDEPWSLALRAVLETHQLGFIELSPTMVRIDTLENLDKEKQLLETIRQRALTLTPPKTLVHRLSYAKAEDANTRITALLDPTRHGPAKIATDARTNSLVINAIPTTLAMIQEIIKRLDLPTPQVDIASRIIESTSNSGKSFGIAWGAPISRDAGRGLGFGTLTFPNYVVGDFAVDATTARQPFQTTMRWGSINDAFELDMALQFGQSQSFVEILQTNNVVVQDNNEAEINTGQIDYIETFAEGGDGLVEINYTLSLKVTPQITSNGMVNMAISIDSAEPAQVEARNGAAARSTKMIKTLLMKRSGETAVIGGLYTNQRGKSTRGVPFFASIPIIGALFRSDIQSVEKREIMIMITPTILANGSTYDQQIQDGSDASPAEFVNAGTNNMFESAAAQNQALNQQQGNNQQQMQSVQGENQFQQVQGQNQFQQVQGQNQIQEVQGQNQFQQGQGQNQFQQGQSQNQFQQAQGQNVQQIQGQNQFQQTQGQNQLQQNNSNEQDISDENEFNFEQ